MSAKTLKLEGLKSLIHQQKPIAVKEFVDDIVNFFDFHLTTAELDAALEKLFNRERGTIAFLNETIQIRNGLYGDSNVGILTLWHNLLVKHSGTVNFGPFVDNIVECCMRFITSHIGPSAKERERAAMVMHILIYNRLIDACAIDGLLERILAVFNVKKPPELFIFQIFKTVGAMVVNYKDSISSLHSRIILAECLKVLDSTTSSHEDIRSKATAGAIECLIDYLSIFKPSPGTETETYNRIYPCIRKLSEIPADIKQKITFRSAIEFFTQHAALFSKQVYKDYMAWHKCLDGWLLSKNYEDTRRGVLGFYAFYKVVADEMKAEEMVNIEALTFILTRFRNTLESASLNPQQCRVAIKGFGAMSQLCKKHLPSMLNDLISLVIQRCELVLLADDNAMRDLLDHFPDYIHALATVIEEVRDPMISDMIVENLTRIIIRLIRDFHFLPTSQCSNVVSSIQYAFKAIYVADASLFEGLLAKVIFEGVVLTCSHKHVFDANDDWADNVDWKNNITFKSYSILWHALLDERASMRTSTSTEIIARITDQLILTLYQILDRLNLRTKKRVYTTEDGQVQELYFCDPNFDLCPVHPKDFHIFINLVDFYRDIWPKFDVKCCASWIERFCEQMVKFALRYPLISGFLKLLTLGLGTAEDLQLFSGDLTPTFEATLSYALNVMIVNCQRVSGELLISTLELVLQYPVKFLNKCVIEMIPVFETALDLGKSMGRLAILAIDCLQRISNESHDGEVDILHSKVLPLLDSYLQGHCSVEHISVRGTRGRNKVQKIGAAKKTQMKLHDIQEKIISLFGQLPPEAASMLVMASAKAENLVKWDCQKFVHLELRLSDMSATIYLDAMVPRICDLAVTSTHRQTKIAACEVVHALVLYMIGARIHEGQTWTELCKRMLILGSDSDPTVQQMFEPLLMQVMHFMSKYENLDKGVEELMTSLMDGISNKSNFSLRDLSASCLREFVEWSMKQTTPQQLAASTVSIDIILGRLKMYSFDSDGCKRVGAALAFNNLYRILREDESICDKFFISLLHTFCINLKLSEELTPLPPNEDTNSDLEMISEALDHVMRVLIERSYLYERSSDRRVVPSVLNSGTLKDVLIFLVFEAGTRKIFYRRKCMKIAQDLAARMKGFLGLCDLTEKALVSDNQLWQICEGAPDGCGIRARPDLTFLANPSHGISENGLYNWLESFLASLECYTWLLNGKVIAPRSKFFNQTKVLDVLSYYLDEICWRPTSDILQRQAYGETGVMENIKVLKGLISVEIVAFLTEFLSSQCADEMGLRFWTTSTNCLLRRLITQLIFEPDHLNLDFRLDRIHSQLESRLNKFCQELAERCPYKDFFSELNEDVFEIVVARLRQISEETFVVKASRDTISSRQSVAKGILYVLRSLDRFSIPAEHRRTLSSLCKSIIKQSFDGLKGVRLGKAVATTYPDHIKSMANSLLYIVFEINDFSLDIMDYLMDSTVLYTTGFDSKVKHGWLYFETFKNVITKHAKVRLFEKCFALACSDSDGRQIQALKVLSAIMDYKIQRYTGPDSDFRSLAELCVACLPKLVLAFQNKTDDFHLTEFVSILARIPFIDVITNNEYTLALSSWIVSKLQSHQLSLERKCKFISLLPVIVGPTHYENTTIMSALEDLQRQHFPLRSTEFSKNSLEETSLKFAFVTLLNTLVASKSYVILEFLFKCTASDEEHLMEDAIRKELKSFTKSLNSDEQEQVLRRTLATVMNEAYESIIRLTIYKRFFLTIFANCFEKTLLTFFENEILHVQALTDSNYRASFSNRTVEQALVNRIIGYRLIEHFFGIIRKELYWSVSSPIAIKLLGQPKGDSELVGTLTKKAFYVRNEVLPSENKDAAELFRRYQCAAYTALCSLVVNTQRELKFYSKFLFEENARKNEVIWSRIVDCSAKSYVFPGQEMEEHAKFKKRFVAIRQLDVRPPVSLKKITSSKRLQTQVIMESSLSQDIRLVDMTSYAVRSYADALQRRETIPAEDVLSVHLESHDLNKHEVMPMLCGVIKFMHTNEITPTINDTRLKRSYPWVQAIADSIGRCENHKNIRVFLAQVVLNCSEVFGQFAHVLFGPILRMLADECAGRQLNFFITDMVTLLIGWTSEKLHAPRTAEEIALVQDLLKFMMKNAWHDKKEILKYNLEIVQTMITIWREVIKVPSSLLLDLITRTQRKNSTANEGGIIFLGMILTNDIIPWTDLNKVLYINAILNNIDNESVSVYQPAAYALGLTLNALSKSDADKESAENLLDEIYARLHDLRSRRDTKSEKRFMDLVYNIHKSNPQIADSLRETICFKIPFATGAAKKIYLEIILSRIEGFSEEEIYSTIVGIGIRDLLKHFDYQLLALHILNRSLPMLKTYDITDLFQLVEEALALQQPECRDIAYEICIYVAQNFTNELRDKAVKLLLKGVGDPNVEIQKRIYHFWSKEANISPQISDRIIHLLQQYAIEGEQHFLGLCTQLLLDPVVESPDSKKQIFAYENEHSVKLHEYPISTKQGSRAGYTLPPLFAESQQNPPSIFKATQMCSLIRDTNAEYVFEPTQDPGTISQARSSFTLPSSSSMPFQIATQVLNRRSERIAPQHVAEKVPRLQSRRFLKDTDREKRETVHRIISVRQKKAEQQAEKLKDKNVALYRRYRYGEYPDLLINNLAFLLPLQALARRDLLIAKQLFVSILTAIVEISTFDKHEFLQKIDGIFQVILQNSTSCESTTFAALLEVSLLKPSAFNLPPSKVTEVAKMTKNLTIGALYLESRLNADWDVDALESPEPQHWLQLADIYSSLKEYEVTSAIFADKLRTDPRLAKAIELRANGRIEETQTLLLEVIARNVHIEHYYAFNCFYECLMELGNWSQVCQAINQEIDDIEELWTDKYNQNFLLPKLMHARTQLLLEGDSENRGFLRVIDDWLAMPQRAEYIRSEFCEELMMLWFTNKSFRQCHVLYENFLKRFLRDWSITSSLYTKTKLGSLLSAQRVAEIDYYADHFLQGFKDSSAKEFCNRWDSCVIYPSSSLLLWNTLVSYRRYIAHMGGEIGEDTQQELNKSVFYMSLQLFNLAEQQENFALAQNTYERLVPDHSDTLQTFKHEMSKVKNVILQSKRSPDWLNSIEPSWCAVDKLLQDKNFTQHHEMQMEALKLVAELAKLVLNRMDKEPLTDEAETMIRQMIGGVTGELRRELLELTLNSFAERATIALTSPSVQRNVGTESLNTLAQFSYDALNGNEMDSLYLEKVFLQAVLGGMRYGSKESRQLFPCVLQLPSMETGALHDDFLKYTTEIPVWAFLAWIPQILSRLQFHEPSFLDHIVKRIAAQHLEALRYPFIIWHKQAVIQYQLSHDNQSPTNRELIASILEQLQHKLHDKFIKSFRYLSIPESFLMAQLDTFIRDVRNHPNITTAHFSSLMSNLIKDVYCDGEGIQGDAYRTLTKYRKELEAIRDMPSTKGYQLAVDKIRQKLLSHLETIEMAYNLDKICPWLANFQWCGEEDHIEMPGQYAPNCLDIAPTAKDHIKVVRFDSKVHIFKSQRHPLRISIHGSNGRSYDYLVKHGEDLKQDQRIQQILQLMSQKLKEDKNGQLHNLFIRTYQVIPFDRNCGILSWVGQTVSLNDFVFDCFKRHTPNSIEIMNQTKRAYLTFIGRPSNATSNMTKTMIYGTAVSTYTNEQLKQNLLSLQNQVDCTILRQALMDMALSPGSFFTLRNNFATSLAVMNIAHWVLGVGDRHLENTLISIKDGSVTGIDFGFTFGSGTRDQGVPELTPFRLTSHIVHAMMPMGTSGLISKCMVHALRVFRSSDRILLACMEVFIREPLINWLNVTPRTMNQPDEWVLSAWEPRDRIDIAKCKLQGHNPMNLFERELRASLVSRYSEFLDGYLRVLHGDIQFNERARLPKDKLTVEEQVRCLIDQATDPAVLGISYVGLLPWI